MTQQSGSGSDSLNASSGTSPSIQESVGSTVNQVTNQAKDTVGQVTGQARQQVQSRITGQKDRAAEGLTGVAQALRQTGQQLRDQDQTGFTGYIDSAAAQVERVSDYLRGKDVGELIDDVEHFARRQPALFVGGAFVLGVLGTRFLKSSRQKTRGAGHYPLANQYAPGGASNQGYQGIYTTPSDYRTGSSGITSTSRSDTATNVTDSPAYSVGSSTTDASTLSSASIRRTTEEQ